MPKPARERLARLLGGDQTAGSFSAQVLLPSDGLKLDVDGVGQIRLPVKPAQARKIAAVAGPAKFGHREETILDPTVRDTWEVSPDLVTVDAPVLDEALAELADELGVKPGCRLEAELHALLVYGPGQFFAPHQDTEKSDAMIGTLTITLPSAHTGGELIVEHGGQSVTYRPSRDSLSLVAFYADCLHQVSPVRAGYRTVLTFNLLLRGTPEVNPDGPVGELAGYLSEHFDSPEQVRYGSGNKPKRLVYLLDHAYTERGLRWDKLKGADADRAALVRAAADKAGCETVLALAEIKETWDTEGRKATYIINSELTLDWWNGENISLWIREPEICATTPTAQMKPYQSEYTGYMGNWGGTRDRWYRRAAIAVWPRERSFAAQAEASAAWGLGELKRLAEAGDLAAARIAASSAEPFWAQAVSAQQGTFEPALDVAAALDSAETATMLLRPYRVEMLSPQHAPAVLVLAGRYGPRWTEGMLATWFDTRSRPSYPGARTDWVASLPILCATLGDAGGVSSELIAQSWRWLTADVRHWLGWPAASARDEQLTKLGKPLLNLLEAAANEMAIRDEIITFAREHRDAALPLLIAALRAASPDGAPDGLRVIADQCSACLGEFVSRPMRAEDDWSITWSGTCGCDLCATFGEFLGDASRRTLEWPLAEARRKHITDMARYAELPIRHQVLRVGSPHTLVLTKTDTLFELEDKARQRSITDLAWLTQQWVR